MAGIRETVAKGKREEAEPIRKPSYLPSTVAQGLMTTISTCRTTNDTYPNHCHLIHQKNTNSIN